MRHQMARLEAIGVSSVESDPANNGWCDSARGALAVTGQIREIHLRTCCDRTTGVDGVKPNPGLSPSIPVQEHRVQALRSTATTTYLPVSATLCKGKLLSMVAVERSLGEPATLWHCHPQSTGNHPRSACNASRNNSKPYVYPA